MDGLIGNSLWARKLRRAIRQVAGSQANVLIIGSTGTGKELIARAIHRQSRRATGPLVALDCTSIPPSLFPSQLFGHVKGAFSGAECDTLGCFRAADGGTIFLDEIGELTPELQAQLLRVIQERTVIPVGSHRAIPVDVRIITATSRNLPREVGAGSFRLDLYYRLNVVKLRTTSLRDRPEDIEPLCRHFLAKLSIENGLPQKCMAPSALRVLTACHWPGNVRQLQNVLERIVIFTDAEEITDEHVCRLLEPDVTPPGDVCTAEPGLPRPAGDGAGRKLHALLPSWEEESLDAWPTLEDWERRLIEETLERTFYNQSATARLLNVDRRLLARKIRKYGIELPCLPGRARPR